MINFYIGIPGSGKTYSSVYTIYNNFSDDKKIKKHLKKDYVNCYTNINEFKFETVPNIIKFDYNIFYSSLQILYAIDSAGGTDKDLKKKAEELKICNTLIVLDECHKFLSKDDDVLVWWLTYHRHLYHDVFLITQNLGLIHTKYKTIGEAYFKAKSSSLVLNKKYFHYTHFTDYKMTKDSKVQVIKIPKLDKVFKLYHSGDKVVSKNVIMHFIIIAFGFFVLLSILIYFFYKSKSDDIVFEKSENTVKHNVNDLTVNEDKTTVYNSDKILTVFNCTSICTNDSLTFPFLFVRKMINDKDFILLYTERVSQDSFILYLSSSHEFYNFLNSSRGNKGAYNDKENVTIFGN